MDISFAFSLKGCFISNGMVKNTAHESAFMSPFHCPIDFKYVKLEPWGGLETKLLWAALYC